MKKIAMAAALVAMLGTGQASAASYDDLNAAIRFRNLKQWDEAVAGFDRALAGGDLLPSQQFIAHLDRGEAHRALKQYDLAIADGTAALALQPGNAAALSGRAVAYLDAGMLTQAVADLDTLIAQRPLISATYSLRAAINAKLGRADKSRADSRKILELEPDNYAQRNLSMGIIAWQAGQLAVAQDNFSYALSHRPGGAYPWLWLALTRIRMGKDMPQADIPGFDAKVWPAPLVGFFLGDTTRDAVFTAAGTGDEAGRERLCEANFYIGEWRLQHHDTGAARPMLQKAASDCPMTFVEWSPAQSELAGLPQ
jgi:lipoprotein NlpI